jgi:hypothetical protein
MTSLRNNQWTSGLASTLRQPQWIAAILSVGFHGALFALGPSFAGLNMAALGGNTPEMDERRVPLIELTAEEQGRLPDFSGSAYSLFPEGDDDLFSLFPSEERSLPSPTPFGSMPDLPPANPPSASTITPFSASPLQPSLTLPARRSPLPSILNGPSPSAALPTPPRPAPNGTEPPAAESGPTPTDRPAPESPGAADLELSQRQEPGSEPDASMPLNEEPQAANGSGQELLARVEYSDRRTSSADVAAAQEDWLGQLTAKLGDEMVMAEEPLEMGIPYNQRICLSPEPAQGLLGMALLPGANGDGRELSTAVLKSTGYPFLNQAALQALQDLNAEADSGLEPGVVYQVQVNVDYDGENCVSSEALLKSRTAAQEEAAETTEE